MRARTSMTVTASTTSFLCIFEPGRSRSLTMWVMPALYPANAVRWTRRPSAFLQDDDGLATWLLGVVLGEGLDAAPVTGCTLAGQEPERAVARRFKLAVTGQTLGAIVRARELPHART